MLYTSNLGLRKPEGTDVVDIDDFNANADLVDATIGDMESVPTSAKTVVGAINELANAVSAKADAVSPIFTGTVTLPGALRSVM